MRSMTRIDSAPAARRPMPRLLRAPLRLVGRLAGATAAALLAASALVAAPRVAHAQWTQVYEQFYLQAPHNWVFRRDYQAADRLFNAFDYGHAILYETLWTKPNAPASELEVRRYDHLTKRVLVRPPRVPLEEAAIQIRYVQLAPEAKQMFEWAHILHRQLYDVLADERLDQAAKDREVQRLLDYYKSRRDVAFSSQPKSMKLMQEQPYSLAFRQRYPKFNGLIWAYHWLQVGLYEPLVVGRDQAERQAGVRATTARFWQMLENPPRTFPHQMPMTPAVAPEFTRRYPEAAIIFDNLHSMHDVISDILANDAVPRDRKRAEILLAARRYRDDTSYVMTPDAWVTMSRHMGLENMGGPAVRFIAALPTPTVTYGAVMQHDDRTGAMVGFGYGRATGDGHAAHGATSGTMSGAMSGATPAATPGSAPAAGGHAHHDASAPSAAPANGHDHGGSTPARAPESRAAPGDGHSALHERMLADPVIRARLRADTTLRRLMTEAHGAQDAHDGHAAAVTKDASAAPPPRSPARPPRPPAAAVVRPSAQSSARSSARPSARPARPADPHAAHRGGGHGGHTP